MILGLVACGSDPVEPPPPFQIAFSGGVNQENQEKGSGLINPPAFSKNQDRYQTMFQPSLPVGATRCRFNGLRRYQANTQPDARAPFRVSRGEPGLYDRVVAP